MIKPEVINKLRSITELQLLTHIVKNGDWIHSKYTRPIIADLMGVAEITVKKTLKNLVQKTLVEKISKGLYRINKDIIQ